MSRSSKPLTLARVEDLTIGSFALVPSSETIDHLVRYLSTWSGSDKLFMIIQYSLKIIVPFLHLRARLQHRAGLRKEPTSSVGTSLAALGGLFGDARMLANVWGLLPIIKWMANLERNPPPTRKLLTIERLQGWSMLAYFPLEHLYYLVSHSIVPTQIPRPSFPPLSSSKPKDSIHIDAGAISRASVRLWAFYVVLQLAHLREDRRLLKVRERAIGKLKGSAAQTEVEELKKRWDALWSEIVVNVAYLPLTLHWSLEKGVFENEIWVGLLGLIAALASWRSGWKATALTPQAVSPTVEPEAVSEKKVVEPPVNDVANVDVQAALDPYGVDSA